MTARGLAAYEGASSVRFALIAPDLGHGPTGGSLYNAGLIAALRARGVSCMQLELDAALGALVRDEAGVVFVDSLYLDAMPALRARLPSARLISLLHYLPSLVALGRVPARGELSANEQRALELADGFLVTSAFMRQALQALGARRPLLCVEPGIPALPPRMQRQAGLRALMLCSVIAGKGVKALLAELGARGEPPDRLELSICGRLDFEPDYVEACRELLRALPWLDARVHFLGPLPHAEALRLLVGVDVLLSASRMESYGMALAEGRAAGVPIIARHGGNIAAHVDQRAGGALVADEAAVARELLTLARDSQQLAARRQSAEAAVRTRSWSEAAQELWTQLLENRALFGSNAG